MKCKVLMRVLNPATYLNRYSIQDSMVRNTPEARLKITISLPNHTFRLKLTAKSKTRGTLSLRKTLRHRRSVPMLQRQPKADPRLLRF